MKSIQEVLGIETPSDFASEQAVLGAILFDETPVTFETVRGRLSGGEFHDPNHGRIYKAMVKVYESGAGIDFVTLAGQLQDSNEIEVVGGVTYLVELHGSISTTANAEYYIDRVCDMHLRRQTIETTLGLLKQAAEEQDINGFLAKAEIEIKKISDKLAPKRKLKKMKDILMEVWGTTEQRFASRHESKGVTGIVSGFTDLDKMTSGFQKSDLIILAARPSVGKTAFALNVSQNVAVKSKETVAIFSLEMGAAQLVTRMVCTEGNIEADKMKTGFFESDDWEKLTMAMGSLSEANILIEDDPNVTVLDIRNRCREIKKEQGLGLILIDYLQLIRGRGGNRQEEVSEISRTLKQLARELDVPIIALSQLSRGVEQRQDKRPMMSDLRESGSIEQDADIVAFLYRDDYYDKQSEKKNIVEMIIAKHRNGPLGTVDLAFLKQFGKFLNLDRQHHEQQKAF